MPAVADFYPGDCIEIYPCVHRNCVLTFDDGKVVRFNTRWYIIRAILRHLNLDASHFNDPVRNQPPSVDAAQILDELYHNQPREYFSIPDDD